VRQPFVMHHMRKPRAALESGAIIACRYEPWGLMYRPALGFFDVRYRGYGRNKIQHLHMHTEQLGWR
jgi:hypothetical protein